MPTSPTVRTCAAVAVLAAAATLVASAAPPGDSTAAETSPLVETVDSLRSTVAEIRGLPFLRDVPVRVIDDAGARAHAIERFEEFQTRDEIARDARAYALLGLLPPGFDVLGAVLDAIEVEVGGFYDPGTGEFYVLDRVPKSLVRIVIAHELTHALEDQHYDLDRRIRDASGDDDRLVAVTAVSEGSATLLMDVYAVRGVADGEIDAAELASVQADVAAPGFAALPDVLRREMVAPYVLGAAFLARGRAAHAMLATYPRADIDRVYADPPQSSEQILHPERYWDDDRRDEPVAVDLGDAGERLGHRWTRAAAGTLGELTLGPLVGAPTPAADGSDPNALFAAAWTNRAASGWGGDRWELWTRGDRDAVLLSTVWDTERDADEFAAALPVDTGLRWRRAGRSVAVVGGVDGRRASRVLDAMLAAVARLEDLAQTR